MKKYYLLSLTLCFILNSSCKTETEKLFVGTFTSNGSEGLYSYSFNSTTGEITNKKLEAKLTDPSFLTISENKKYLYTVEKTDEFKNSKGAVTAFKIENDRLSEINTVGTSGGYPCHVGISKKGDFLAASCYGDGSLSVYKVAANGALEENPQYIDHKVLDTVKTSHAHASLFTSDGLFTADLGLDAIKRYSYDGEKHVADKQASINLPDGAGPRHFKFNKNGKFLYVINEVNSTITVFQKQDNGNFTAIETQSTVAENYTEKSYCADIHFSKDGKFLYGSNRGENTIVSFKVNQETGKLTLADRESVRGDWPRNFVIDPTDNFLLVANERSNNITVFKRNTENGSLEFLHETKLPSPVCLEFL